MCEVLNMEQAEIQSSFPDVHCCIIVNWCIVISL